MSDATWVDTSLDVRTDAHGKDPDFASPTLRRYHQLLWSKPLPDGDAFELDITASYLHHSSPRGEFWLSSDSVMATFVGYQRMQSITDLLSRAEQNKFTNLAYTIGAMMVFPANKVGRSLTINGARGFLRKISDRIDLTLECIRRHYRSEDSPLAVTLQRYADFFALFGDFSGYVDFFLLQDLVTPDKSQVKFFTPFDNFASSGLPRDIDAYRTFRRLSMEFVRSRNTRIDGLWGRTQSSLSANPPTRGASGHEQVVMGRVRRRR